MADSVPVCAIYIYTNKHKHERHYTRIMIRTHPEIASERVLSCSKCLQRGHTARGCKKDNATVLTEEMAKIAGCFLK